jgi:putative oxidoreductase
MVTLTHDRPNESLRHHNATSAARELAEEQHDRWTMTRKKTLRRKRLWVAGRLLISSLFIIGAIFKIIYYGGSLDSLALAGISDGDVVLPVAIALELIGGGMIAAGFRVRVASLGLLGYLALLTVLLNWDLSADANRAQALWNLALAGSLLLLMSQGAGGLSVDRWAARRSIRRYSAA